MVYHCGGALDGLGSRSDRSTLRFSHRLTTPRFTLLCHRSRCLTFSLPRCFGTGDFHCCTYSFCTESRPAHSSFTAALPTALGFYAWFCCTLIDRFRRFRYLCTPLILSPHTSHAHSITHVHLFSGTSFAGIRHSSLGSFSPSAAPLWFVPTPGFSAIWLHDHWSLVAQGHTDCSLGPHLWDYTSFHCTYTLVHSSTTLVSLPHYVPPHTWVLYRFARFNAAPPPALVITGSFLTLSRTSTFGSRTCTRVRECAHLRSIDFHPLWITPPTVFTRKFGLTRYRAVLHSASPAPAHL